MSLLDAMNPSSNKSASFSANFEFGYRRAEGSSSASFLASALPHSVIVKNMVLKHPIKIKVNNETKNLESENEALKSTIQSSNENIDIGNGVLLSQEFLHTIKATSGTVNIFGRTMFRKLFQPHQLIGCSLIGKGFNANPSQKLPPVDPARRDALIGKIMCNSY